MLALLGAHHILYVSMVRVKEYFNTFNAELNPICHLLALLGAHHILHIRRIRVKGLSFRSRASLPDARYTRSLSLRPPPDSLTSCPFRTAARQGDFFVPDYFIFTF